jgi:DNA invertase Pin-like site-specific DNA recombinase
MTTRIRCAIYTRKSTDDGLEQEFNSLDAQREACEAFIKSQRGMGWVALPAGYDDGGISGGTIDRPALRRLLVDIELHKIDLVVVYKVDRLTRSLADFAKIVEVFDAQGVSFVSVTQQFNTATSMGRLTLNMLLSFAQFEREVTGERIRDKIAASKQKGMWMGGPPPLGYDVENKKLIVNKAEAETVKRLFQLYLELGSVRLLKREADRHGLVTKRRQRDDRTIGGKPFSRGNLYQLLHNALYVGEIPHQGKTYPGQHEGIIDREVWDAVQHLLSNNAPARRSDGNVKGNSLLTGLVFDETGDPLCSTYAVKKGRRYRYYISKRLVHAPDPHGDGWRMPAQELEGVVRQSICKFLKNETGLIEAVPSIAASPRHIRRLIQGASELAAVLSADAPDEDHEKLRSLIHRSSLSQTAIRIEIPERNLLELVFEQVDDIVAGTDRLIHVDVPTELRRRGVETKLIIQSSDHRAPDERLIQLIARSFEWMEQLSVGSVGSVREIARRDDLDEGDVSRFLPLAYLAPDIIEEIVCGKQPTELTGERLRHACPIPIVWQTQQKQYGLINEGQAKSL